MPSVTLIIMLIVAVNLKTHDYVKQGHVIKLKENKTEIRFSGLKRAHEIQEKKMKTVSTHHCAIT